MSLRSAENDRLSARLSTESNDPAVWKALLNNVATRSITEASKVYDAFLEKYPNTVQAQIQYLSHYTINSDGATKAQALFQQFLKASPCVELWITYLTYVRASNTLPAQQNEVRDAYEFALRHVGQAHDSGPIWMDYIRFLKVQNAQSEKIRRVYEHSIQTPLPPEVLERLWFDFRAFQDSTLLETEAYCATIRFSPLYKKARAVYCQLFDHLKAIGALHPPSGLYIPSLPRFTLSERVLVGKWKTYLRWEEGDPLGLKDTDKPLFLSRLRCAYRRALIPLYHYPEIWFMAGVALPDEKPKFLKAGLDANPGSFLLAFAYSEVLEMKQDHAGVHKHFWQFINTLKDGFTLRTVADREATHACQRCPAGHAPCQNVDLGEHRAEYGVVWIMFMRFVRRTEGLEAARSLFSKASADPWTPWTVHEAAALMEHCCSHDTVAACKIFGEALKIFGEDVRFVDRYLEFLISANKVSDARRLIEDTISHLSPDQAQPLWERLRRHENQYGDLEAVLALERQISSIYKHDSQLKRFASRHTYASIDAIANRDLGLANYLRHTPEHPHARPPLETMPVGLGEDAHKSRPFKRARLELATNAPASGAPQSQDVKLPGVIKQ